MLGYRNKDREKSRFTIGRCSVWHADAARIEARKLLEQIRNGKDPLEEKYNPPTFPIEPTVNDLADSYLEGHVLSKRSAGQSNDRRMIDGIIRPRLGERQVKAVEKSDLQKLHHSLNAAPYRANRILSLLSKMFVIAYKEKKWRDYNPVEGIERYPEDERTDSWIKDVDDLARLNKALDEYQDQDAANAIRVLLRTGARNE